MSRPDAESLIARTEGRLCVRFYRRGDGSIITKDCPVGLRAIRRRVSYFAKAIGSMVLGLFAGLGVHEAFTKIVPFRPERTMGVMAQNVDPPVQFTSVEEGTMSLGKMVSKSPRQRHTSAQNKNPSNR
jgi:hypothetical protein